MALPDFMRTNLFRSEMLTYESKALLNINFAEEESIFSRIKFEKSKLTELIDKKIKIIKSNLSINDLERSSSLKQFGHKILIGLRGKKLRTQWIEQRYDIGDIEKVDSLRRQWFQHLIDKGDGLSNNDDQPIINTLKSLSET